MFVWKTTGYFAIYSRFLFLEQRFSKLNHLDKLQVYKGEWNSISDFLSKYLVVLQAKSIFFSFPLFYV